MEAQNKCKKYRNLLLILLKNKVNDSILLNFFQKNMINLKNTWKEIKSSSLKSSNETFDIIIDNNATLKNPIAIANAFNKYFFLLQSNLS